MTTHTSHRTAKSASELTAATTQCRMKPTQEAFDTAVAFRHNPYGQGSLMFYVPEQHAPPTGPVPLPADAPLPDGTLHATLHGRVGFVPYPAERFVLPPEAAVRPGEATERLFLGQLPYRITEMQLAWLCYTFGEGHAVTEVQRIVKRQARGVDTVECVPTGCLHALCTPAAVEVMSRAMHKRLLIDDTGVWYAVSDAETAALRGYVAGMKKDRRRRVPDRPYDSVTVQAAESHFTPAQPVWIHDDLATPPRRATPPPCYAEAVRTLPPPPTFEDTFAAPVCNEGDGMETWRC